MRNHLHLEPREWSTQQTLFVAPSLGLEMQKFSLLLNVQSPLKADMLLFKQPKGTSNCLNMTLIWKVWFSGTRLNWTEVIVEKELLPQAPAATLVFAKLSYSTCPSSHPFAFSSGTKCCQTSLQTHPKNWDTAADGLLNFDSISCYGYSTPSFINCMTDFCFNEQFKSYSLSESNQFCLPIESKLINISLH